MKFAVNLDVEKCICGFPNYALAISVTFVTTVSFRRDSLQIYGVARESRRNVPPSKLGGLSFWISHFMCQSDTALAEYGRSAEQIEQTYVE